VQQSRKINKTRETGETAKRKTPHNLRKPRKDAYIPFVPLMCFVAAA
jgi:hypothetical protein